MTDFERYATGYWENVSWDMKVLERKVIEQLRATGISQTTKRYLTSRKWDMTNDYMLDNTDAMESYIKRNSKPNYKHVCAVLLEGKY